tara:strand:+ start:1489 stop:1884 length:396 start_codon:yes stop_codon:yes gene_type:complete
MSSSDVDDFTDAEEKKIQLLGCEAEQEVIKTFVTQVSAPSRAECEEAIQWRDNGTSVQILAAFGDEQYVALKDMWENCFSKDVVQSYAGMGDDHCMIMFNMRSIVSFESWCTRTKSMRRISASDTKGTPKR